MSGPCRSALTRMRWLAVAGRVGEQVHQDLLQAVPVGVHHEVRVGRDDGLLLDGGGERIDRHLQLPSNGLRVPAEADGRRLPAGQVDDVGDHPAQVERLFLDVLDHLAPLDLGESEPFEVEELGVALDGREGSAQAVGHGSQDGVSLPLGDLLHLASGHPLAGGREGQQDRAEHAHHADVGGPDDQDEGGQGHQRRVGDEQAAEVSAVWRWQVSPQAAGSPRRRRQRRRTRGARARRARCLRSTRRP